MNNLLKKCGGYFPYILLVVFVVLLFVLFGNSKIYGKTHFRAYGRNFSVSQDCLKVICVEDIDFKKVSPVISDLNKIISSIVKVCSDNFNAQLYYGNGD